MRAAALTLAALLTTTPLIAGSPAEAARRRCLGRTVTIHGTPEADVIPTSDGSDVVKAGRGDDVVLPSRGQDFLCGNRGEDTLIGGTGEDWAAGGRGDDACDAEHEQGCERNPVLPGLQGWEQTAG